MNESQVVGRTFVIAEAGVNHNGSLELARRLVEVAKAAGADAVKFQDFRADTLVAAAAPKAAYQRIGAPGDDLQHAMLKALELDADQFKQLRDHCVATGIEFLASPFDEAAVDRLVKLGMRLVKVPSGEITNLPFLEHVAQTGLPVILSTGMSWLSEVEIALRTLRVSGARDITVLQCVTEYPAPPEQINLRAMHTMAAAFDVPIGYSDHTPGTEIAVAAVALGARVIEKHLTLDRSMPGPDHSASLDPASFQRMVTEIRNVERALGSGRKEPAPVEVPNIVVARKSLVVTRSLAAGHRLEPGDLAIKRPGSGIAPGQRDAVTGRLLSVDVKADHVLQWSDLA